MVTEGQADEEQAADRIEGCPVSENHEPQLSEEEQRRSGSWLEGLCDELSSKDKLDAPRSQKSFSKPFQKAEALLRTHFNPSLRWLLGAKAEDEGWDGESQDTFVACQDLTSRSSFRLQRLQQGMLGASQQCQVVRGLCTGFPQGCVRGLASAEGSVLHHPPSATLSRHYGRLQNLLEQRALLLFLHEYARRTRVASGYVARLAGMLEGELGWSGGRDRPPLEGLNSACSLGLAGLCQELRVHVRHWEALCARARSDPYLRPVLPQRTEMLDGMRRTLGLLALQALVLAERCVYAALSALAAARLASVPRDGLEELLAAAELYNQVVEEQRGQQQGALWRSRVLQQCDWPGPEGSPPGSGGRHPAPFPVVELMRILAVHRGRMAAEQLHLWASQQTPLSSQPLRPGNPTPSWEQLQLAFPLLSPLPPHLHPSEPGPDGYPLEIKVQLHSQVHSQPQSKPQSLPRAQPYPWSTEQPLAAFIRQDRRSLELLFQALVSSTELLAPHIPHRPTPDRHTPHPATPDRHTPQPARHTPDATRRVFHRPPDTTDRPERTAIAEDYQGPSLPGEAEDPSIGEARQEVRRPRSVQWLDEGQSGACLELFGQYRSMLWRQCGRALLLRFHHPPAGGALGSVNQWRDQMVLQLVSWLNHACRTELVPEECRGVVVNFTVHLLTSTAFRHWDHMLCMSLGSGLKDKCLPGAECDGSMVMTSTMERFLQLAPPLLTVMQCLSHAPNTHTSGPPCEGVSPRAELLLGCVLRSLASIQTSTLWVMGKSYQFLSSWSLIKFLLVTQGDLKVLRASAERLLQQTETLSEDEEQHHHHHPPAGRLRRQVVRLRQAVVDLQVFSEMVMRIFSLDCKKMSGQIFEQTMPSAKHWRLGYKTVFPSSPSDYAASAAQTVIVQVLEGVRPLPDEARGSALTEAMTAFMEAWMEHILKHKIKFSIQGALQLKQDFELVRNLIRSEEYSLSEDLHQRLLSLRVFQQVDSAIVCLLQQPMAKPYMPRGWEAFRRCCPNSASVVDQAVGSMNNLENMEVGPVCQQVLTRGDSPLTPALPLTTPPESYLALGHAQQEWLDLRIHGSSRWRLPGLNCLTKSEP